MSIIKLKEKFSVAQTMRIVKRNVRLIFDYLRMTKNSALSPLEIRTNIPYKGDTLTVIERKNGGIKGKTAKGNIGWVAEKYTSPLQ